MRIPKSRSFWERQIYPMKTIIFVATLKQIWVVKRSSIKIYQAVFKKIILLTGTFLSRLGDLASLCRRPNDLFLMGPLFYGVARDCFDADAVFKVDS